VHWMQSGSASPLLGYRKRTRSHRTLLLVLKHVKPIKVARSWLTN